MVDIHSKGDNVEIAALTVHSYAAHAGLTDRGIPVVLLNLDVTTAEDPDGPKEQLSLLLSERAGKEIAAAIERSTSMLAALRIQDPNPPKEL